MSLKLNAVAAINNAVAAVGEDGDSWEVVGEPLTSLVDEVVPSYDDKLDLKLDPSAGAKRAEICTIRWGRIDKDIARLQGLADAVRNVASVVRNGRETIAHDWKGESYDAFRAKIEKVEKTLGDYATAVETTANGLKAAIDGARRQFTAYRDHTLDEYLAFGKLAPPAEWRRMNDGDAAYLADRCTSHQGMDFAGNCSYDNEPFQGMIRDKLVTRRLFDQLEKWDCTNNMGVVTGQYTYVVDSAYQERAAIRDKIHSWYEATDRLKTMVTDALDAALENLRIIADLKVFAVFSSPGAAAPGGGPGPGAGDPGPGAGGGPAPGPAPEPPPPIAVDPTTSAAAAAAPAPIPSPETVPAPGPETVSIKDGDRTISVTSPDGQGHVKVTVDNGTGTGTGTPKSYALDFDAASGLAPRPGTEPTQQQEEGVEQIPASTNGKCVIQDGPLTITAERPLFSPDSLSITVDDGTGSPTNYVLDFPEESPTGEAPAGTESATGAESVAPGGMGGQPADARGAAPAESAAPGGQPADARGAAPAESAVPGGVDDQPADSASRGVGARPADAEAVDSAASGDRAAASRGVGGQLADAGAAQAASGHAAEDHAAADSAAPGKGADQDEDASVASRHGADAQPAAEARSADPRDAHAASADAASADAASADAASADAASADAASADAADQAAPAPASDGQPVDSAADRAAGASPGDSAAAAQAADLTGQASGAQSASVQAADPSGQAAGAQSADASAQLADPFGNAASAQVGDASGQLADSSGNAASAQPADPSGQAAGARSADASGQLADPSGNAASAQPGDPSGQAASAQLGDSSGQPADPSGQAAGVQSADASGQAASAQPADPSGQAAGVQSADPSGQPATTQPDQATHAQSWIGDQKGSLSGVLESGQGEAGLASVPDAPVSESEDATGMAGSGLPMAGGGSSAGGAEPGRVGSGWSVHGDLFDSGEPVYSVHGVLGDDDLEPREAR